MTSCHNPISRAKPHAHSVQLYQADGHALVKNVGQYIAEGLRRGEGVLVIATPEHSERFTWELEALNADPERALREKRLVFHDAAETLAQFMVEGAPEWNRFEAAIGSALRQVQTSGPQSSRRAYGEMVGILWEREQCQAAIELEEFWNRLLQAGGVQLFCAYPVDVFGREFQANAMHPLLCAHSHLVPAGSHGDLEHSVNRAMEDILGAGVDGVRNTMNAAMQPGWAAMPAGESAILWLRGNLPSVAEDIIARARQHYQSERRFRSLIENSSDAISLLDTTSEVFYSSASTAKVLGYQPGEITGRNALDLLHRDDAEAVSHKLQEALVKPRRPVVWEARMQRQDGDWFWVESTFTNLLDEPDVRAIVWNCRDITERKLLEAEKEQKVRELAAANAELQAFAYAAAHDLREPLRTVGAYTELLLQERSDEKRRVFSGIVVEGVKRMSALLDGVLSLTRLSVHEPPREFNLGDSAAQAVRNLDALIKESGASVRIDTLPVIRGNASHFVNVFQNLISNAIKYRGDSPPAIYVSAELREQEWVIQVEDNGIGISPKYHRHVFGLFKRLHGAAVPGTGIGLALCRKVVEGMGGRIWVHSQPGDGSTFCIAIPSAVARTAGPRGSSGAAAK